MEQIQGKLGESFQESSLVSPHRTCIIFPTELCPRLWSVVYQETHQTHWVPRAFNEADANQNSRLQKEIKCSIGNHIVHTNSLSTVSLSYQPLLWKQLAWKRNDRWKKSEIRKPLPQWPLWFEFLGPTMSSPGPKWYEPIEFLFCLQLDG